MELNVLLNAYKFHRGLHVQFRLHQNSGMEEMQGISVGEESTQNKILIANATSACQPNRVSRTATSFSLFLSLCLVWQTEDQSWILISCFDLMILFHFESGSKLVIPKFQTNILMIYCFQFFGLANVQFPKSLKSHLAKYQIWYLFSNFSFQKLNNI